jgi:hypothetical protein
VAAAVPATTTPTLSTRTHSSTKFHTYPSPLTVKARHGWPSSLDTHIFLRASCATLVVVLILVRPYLTPNDRARMACTAVIYSLGPEYGPLYPYRGWSPNCHRRGGFGVPHQDYITVVTYPPLPHSFIHFVWPFLTPTDQHILMLTCSQCGFFTTNDVVTCFMLAPIATLKHLRPPPGSPTKLPSALPRLHFNHGNFVRWLGGNIKIELATGMPRLVP